MQDFSHVIYYKRKYNFLEVQFMYANFFGRPSARFRGFGASHIAVAFVLACVTTPLAASASEVPPAPTPEFPAWPSAGGAPVLLGEYVLPQTPISTVNPWLGPDQIADPLPDGSGGVVDFSLFPAICSGLHYEGIEVSPAADGSSASRHVFYGVTDVGVSESCSNDASGRFFAFPEYGAAMVKFSLDTASGDIALEQVLPFLSSPGVHTISRDPQLYGQTYTAYDYNTGECSAPIDTPALSNGVKRDDALDSEDLYRFVDPAPGGPTYLVADEFGPGLFVTDETGRIMKSFTHADDAENLDTSFETVAVFPDVLVKARRGRGFEALAVSADERFAWTILQAPATNTHTGAGSNVLRVYKVDISDPLDISVVAEYLYEFEPFEIWHWLDPSAGSNRDLKVSAIDWLAPNKILIGERARSDGLLAFVVDFSTATNILGTPESLLTDPLIETRVAELGIRLPTKDLRFNLADLPEIGQVPKMEGLRAVTDTTLVMCEDSDFAWQTRLWVVQLPRPLPGGPQYSIEQRRPHRHGADPGSPSQATVISNVAGRIAPVSDD